jgi:hypothetical protein
MGLFVTVFRPRTQDAQTAPSAAAVNYPYDHSKQNKNYPYETAKSFPNPSKP